MSQSLVRSVFMLSGPLIGLSGYYWLNFGYYVLFWIGFTLAMIHFVYRHGKGPISFVIVPIAFMTLSLIIFPPDDDPWYISIAVGFLLYSGLEAVLVSQEINN